jgi:hypothetical protein
VIRDFFLPLPVISLADGATVFHPRESLPELVTLVRLKLPQEAEQVRAERDDDDVGQRRHL